ncbi:Triosephosphate isomerase [Pavlovales sp. CCMP2436]|nr:Triosephosphate isomerase [Pavlovales sp. CCMP2436]
MAPSSARRMIVGGNWKCNLTRAQALELADALNAMPASDVEVVVAPIALHLPFVQSALKRAVSVAAQNCGHAGMGAYTGEVSAEQLAAMDVPWVILGHSERRTYFREDDELLAQKLAQALEHGLRVIFCVGESKGQREAGATLEVCKAQLAGVMKQLDPARVVLAYEPIWAIGSGLVATPQQAQETHAQLRAHVAASRSPELAARLRIQYGGSVSAANCVELANLPDVDGFLVGGASLKPADFETIVAACAGRADTFGPQMWDVLAYPALAAATFVPALYPVHPYLHLIVLSTTIVYVGCHRALAQGQLTPGESTSEVVTKKEAMQFPLYGSAVLVGLYAVVKLVKKEYLNLLIALYFFCIGAGAVQQMIRAPLQRLPGVRGLKTHVWSVKWMFWQKDAALEKIEFNALDIPLLLVGMALSAAYAKTKYWLLANVVFLFGYDIFWVFGTEVMVTVAKGIDAPIKLLFPKDLLAAKLEFSLLGLGDIVIPGIFVAMMLRFDARNGLRSLPYFRANLVAYVLALVVTLSVMHFFGAAQPALLYLVPGCLGAAFATALVRGEVALLWRFSEDEPAPEPDAGAEADAGSKKEN